MTGPPAGRGPLAAPGERPESPVDGSAGRPLDASTGAALARAVATVDALRGRDAWHAAQTHASLARYALEEGHEVAAAAEAVDTAAHAAGPAASDALRDELGDLLLQVVLHARLASERDGGFDLADVAGSLVAKARRRHAHVFATGTTGSALPAGVGSGDGRPAAGSTALGPTVAELEAGWEALKDADRAGRDPLDDLPATLPALVRAQKVLAIAGRAGVPAVTPPRAPPTHGTGTAGGPAADHDAHGAPGVTEALGPALLALADAARRAGLDAEQELRASVRALEGAVRAASGPSPR